MINVRLHAAQASTAIYHARRVLQDRTHIVTQILFLSTSRQLALTHSVFLSLYSAFSFHDFFFFYLCDLSWKMLSASAQIMQEVGKGTRDGWERARRAECKGNYFFFPRPTSIQFQSYYLPLALQHCGIEWSAEEASLQQRAHCRLIRALWAWRPPLPAPREAPHTTAPQGQWGPQLRAMANVLNGHGGSFLRGRKDAKGIISFQHGGKGRKWQPLTRLLTQSQEKAFNCCERF